MFIRLKPLQFKFNDNQPTTGGTGQLFHLFPEPHQYALSNRDSNFYFEMISNSGDEMKLFCNCNRRVPINTTFAGTRCTTIPMTTDFNIVIGCFPTIIVNDHQ